MQGCSRSAPSTRGDRYLGGVLPGAIVFGLGLSITVAPLTGAVLGAVEERHLGVASATNNAGQRACLAGLLVVAVLPGLAGFDPTATEGLTDAFGTAMQLSALLCVLGGVVAFLTVRTARPVLEADDAAERHAALPRSLPGQARLPRPKPPLERPAPARRREHVANAL